MTLVEIKDKVEKDAEEFARLGGRIDDYKIMGIDDRELYPVDFQYLMMDRWAFDKVIRSGANVLHDFASRVEFPAYCAAHCKVYHHDIRKPDFFVTGLDFSKEDLVSLSMKDESVRLASCLHVAEHIGLGRYGDKLDPDGFNKACRELDRILAIGGELLFAVPVGHEKVVFNAHRVLNAKNVVKAFPNLTLVEFSGISSHGEIKTNIPIASLDKDTYGCGLFHFKKI